MWRIDSNDASLSAVSVRAVQNPYNKEIPKYARSLDLGSELTRYIVSYAFPVSCTRIWLTKFI
ncbi:hypothetical protein SCLCIDRAFT_1220648, partial [Scleroderma citrinum Foug A]